MAKKYAQRFYNSKLWQRTRDNYRRSVGGLCEDCLQNGIITAGTEVHHVIPLTPQTVDDARFSIDPDNLVLLCHDCHMARHAAMAGDSSPGRRVDLSKPRKYQRYKIDQATGNVTPNAPPTG